MILKAQESLSYLETLKPLKVSVPVELFEHISPEIRPVVVNLFCIATHF